MKYLRKFNESKESIESICQKYGIENYTINDDGSIDVNGDVYLQNKDLTKLPLKFRNVKGNFYCHKNQLTSLEGCPKSVVANFNCSNNQLVSLEGSPQSVGRDFFCNDNQLTSLEGAPQSVGFDFYCTHNQLFNLEFVPSCQFIFCNSNPISKWWYKIYDMYKLSTFIDLGIDARDPDFMNQEKIDLLLEE